MNFSDLFNHVIDIFPVKASIKRAFRNNRQLGRMIFNYSNATDSTETDICKCSNFVKLIGTFHGHVITEYLNIVEDEKSREVMINNTKRRLIISGDNSKIKMQLQKDIENLF